MSGPRQAIAMGANGPVYVDENGNRQGMLAPGLFLDETGGAGPGPPGTTTVFHSPIVSLGAMMNHSS